MAKQQRSGRGKGVPYHPLVEALASDPNKPPERAKRLFGFPGPAAEANSTRLWLDLDLTGYIDVPNDAIKHSQTLEDNRGTILWVDPAATLTYSSIQSHEVQADFLGGSIAERNLAAAVPPRGSIELAAFKRRFESPVGPPCLKPMTGDHNLCHTWEDDCITPVFHCAERTPDLTCPPSVEDPCR